MTAIWVAFILAVITVFTVVGNALVIMSIFTHRPLRSVQNVFLVSLAVADLTVAVFVMPFNIHYHLNKQVWIFGAVACEAWVTCDVLCCTASILNLCAIALDRYWAIHDPLNYVHKRTLRRVTSQIIFVWLISAIISVPPLVGWNDWSFSGGNGPCELSANKGYVVYSASGSFYIPLVIMSIVYLKIYLATRKRLRERANAAAKVPLPSRPVATIAEREDSVAKNHHNDSRRNSLTEAVAAIELSDSAAPSAAAAPIKLTACWEERQRISLSRERRAARILGIVMGVFVLCWLPFFLMYIIMPFCENCTLSAEWANFITWLGYINSSLNPVIYTIFNKDYRKAFKNLLSGKVCWKKLAGSAFV
ncbi:octopamine receptor-like [Varroa jacobsoni]|uniref:octopamine receptor-like n=1 Tax=Varroa jacobsoni TaxID=62625 RepID=UPI000BF71B75|nr:octopamine receptor-like [Varroa jacobsoni]